MPRRILLVDDNPLVLTGLARMLRPHRHEWDIVLAGGGDDALAAIEGSAFDAVVTDMRMPGVDGADLLDAARRRQPGAMRIILTGHVSHEVALRSLRMAHQCLSKPCSAATLSHTINAALALGEALIDPQLRSAVAAIDALPSRPHAYRELLEALQSPRRTTEQIAEIVSRDLGMTCKVLQVANAACFRGEEAPVESVGRAVRQIGCDVVQQLALAPGTFNPIDDGRLLPFVDEHTDRLSTHRRESHSDAVCDVGHLALSTIRGSRYIGRADAASALDGPGGQPGKPMSDSPESVGAYVLALWGIPLAAVLGSQA